MEKYTFSDMEQKKLEQMPVPMAVYQFVNERVLALSLSEGYCRLFSFPDHNTAYRYIAEDPFCNTHPDDIARVKDAAYRFAKEGGRYEVIFRSMKYNGGAYRIIHGVGEHIYTEEGIRLACVWFTDEGSYTAENEGPEATALNRSFNTALHEESMLRANYYSYLTGLPSMSYFFELSPAGRDAIIKAGGIPTLLYMDLRGMKHFNIKHGFAEGDILLKEFAKCLQDVFPDNICGHFGADHFAVITKAQGVEERLDALFEKCSELNGAKNLPVHVGIYQRQDEAVSITVACDRAKTACDSLKNTYSSCYVFYCQKIQEEEENRQYIIENLDRAIEENWIRVYLQPIIRTVNGQVCDVEALARWIDPEKGFLSPDRFIPVLEDAGLVYKLDLYMVDQVVEAIKLQESEGIFIIPHSINLSRSDFGACDIVEEIRKRVDEAGICRDRIIVEITESVIGSDFEFMKEQVERFRELGFPVWMDDFGSGYSSLEILQRIRFDLLKFDRSFMQGFEEGENGKVLLTELMKMATALCLDTVCEGVETEEQVHFLQEIGCSKLQGFFYSKPLPFEAIREMHRTHTLIANENPEESEYYESIGQVNLYDLGVIAGNEEDAFHNVFNMLPIAILEVKDGKARYIRSNRSFRELIERVFHVDILKDQNVFRESYIGNGLAFSSAVRQCCDSGNSVFFDDKMPDGSVVHSYVRRININPVTGSVAVAVAVLSVSKPDDSETYADIALALAADYYNIFVVDLDTDDYVEYSSKVGGEELSIQGRGKDFFESARRETMTRIYEADRRQFLALFTKERVLHDLEAQGVFTTTYRRIDMGTPMYVNMKITRIRGGNRIILGISIIDAHMKQLEEEKKLRQEKISLGRIAALSPDYIVLYTVDPVTNNYTQYSPSKEFADFGLAKQGEDFFKDVILDAPKAIAPEDMERHLRILTKENMLSEIHRTGVFTHHYRLIMNGKYVPVSLKAILVEEEDGRKIILGVTNDENEEIRLKLEEARKIKELNQTITSLLDNMPGITFTKDAGTGVYLACNQAFADYALKETPDGVVGLRDAEIFDAETATHFVEDDRRALSMDKPYIFFEDVPDAAGRARQFQTTKLKYIDAAGRLCLQGMCQDVTDLVRIQRENARTKEAYLQASSTAAIYNHVAHALARECTDLFYVNMETNELIEFHTDDERGVLSEARRGRDFFEGCERDARIYLHPDDQEMFIKAMSREYLSEALNRDKIFELTYRVMKDGKPFYVQMKVSRMEDDPRFIVIAVSDIDEVMQHRREEERIQEERIIYARLHAITGNFIVVYVVDPETNHYREFSATTDYEKSFYRDKEGLDFFSSVRRDARVFTHPQDLERFLAAFTKENVLSEIRHSGIFTLGYRVLMDGRPLHVQMKAAMVEEKEGPRLIVGLNDIDTQVRQEEELEKRLAAAQSQANIDALTGVKNRHAYLEAETHMDRRIEEHRQLPFAIVIFDVNDLKKVNDSKGHQAGDRYLFAACKNICDIFKHSPVYRVGGDEFAVIAQGRDYENIEELVKTVNDHNAEALRSGGIVAACGMAKYDSDECVATVFERADHIMYENKNSLKAAAIKREK